MSLQLNMFDKQKDINFIYIKTRESYEKLITNFVYIGYE